ncbi:aberrant root formation protein 4 [Cajanus cajan]|uniref:Aberrant root formation protein 4 n=1 Tax=Cajanus cajan TaxID=3821 RepID=A0A151RW33_CAJCA|nr:aberrant root formation protein 4 [Cajanus cajan]KYP46762.1 Aberrant root formation protein 4 [Cajanus cajan]
MSVSVEREIVSFRDSDTRSNLRRILESCSKLAEAGDFHESEKSVSELIKFLDSLLDAAGSDPDSDNAENVAFEAISEIHRYVCSPSLDQEVVDALSFELPKAISKFVVVSSKFLDMAISIIDQFIEKCGPRDMLSILCNTLGYSSKMTKASSYILPPLSGLSKVFISIQRRQFEHIKEAVPIILNVLKAVSLESEDDELEDVFDRAVDIANSIYEVCNKLERDAKEKLRDLLGLYVLQCMALVSAGISYKASSCPSLVLQLSQISSYCGLSYLSLLTTYDVETVAGSVFGEDKDHCTGCLSHVKHGAALSVIWGHVSEGVAHTAKEDLIAIQDELRNNQTKRWQAIGTLKHVLSFVNLPWELKKHATDFLLCITDGDVSGNYNEEHSEWSSYMPSLFSALQAVKMVIMYAPEPELRKKSFAVLKGVLADIPISERFDILKALITNTDSSSMIAIFIDLVRKEMHTTICSSRSIVKTAQQIDNKAFPDTSFWNPSVLELVELVLRPPQGGPPSLPEQSDAVLSALNLYRFVLMTESAEKTNHTGVLSRNSLVKAYDEWLLPLRTLVTGIMAESKSDYDEFAVDIECTLNPLELVMYRCIELVEEKLKQST